MSVGANGSAGGNGSADATQSLFNTKTFENESNYSSVVFMFVVSLIAAIFAGLFFMKKKDTSDDFKKIESTKGFFSFKKTYKEDATPQSQMIEGFERV